MRIKSFTGPTVTDAMNKVRLSLGDEAIILATQDLPTGEIQVTAAIEQPDPTPQKIKLEDNWASGWDSDWKLEADQQKPKKAAATKVASRPIDPTPEPKPFVTAKQTKTVQKSRDVAPKAAPEKPKAEAVTPDMEMLVRAMAYHGIPTLLAERICRTALSVETDDLALALAASLDRHFKYSPRFSARKAPLMLIGPPGVGKTMTIAKMAASAKMENRDVNVITTDMSRAGAVDQLKSFTDILGLHLHVVENAEALHKLMQNRKFKDGTHTLIDTGGINPYDEEEVGDLTAKIIAAQGEAVAVLAAGTDSSEMSDMANRFASIGAKRLIATRLDTTRRYGGLFTAADTANLSFSYASVSPAVATGLHAITPVNLARLILRDPTQSDISNEFSKATK
ncbi:flagellar biosynthesis protein FlhF [Sneathiella aquimaris]|uniref:AAA family ATPase n=1 Tax=Sneathiella aquimaris TaxID=2599305 RepID=UPI00146DA35B|nr:AAA family ATPase [Sneathiella aquimaris]